MSHDGSEQDHRHWLMKYHLAIPTDLSVGNKKSGRRGCPFVIAHPISDMQEYNETNSDKYTIIVRKYGKYLYKTNTIVFTIFSAIR